MIRAPGQDLLAGNAHNFQGIQDLGVLEEEREGDAAELLEAITALDIAVIRLDSERRR